MTRSPHQRTLLVTHRARASVIELSDRGQVVIGRSRSCDVFLDDELVSRRHAVIHVQPGHLAVEDLGSHNGTLLLTRSPDSNETQTLPANEIRLRPNVVTPLPADGLVQVGTALIAVQTQQLRPPSRTATPGYVVVDPAMRRVLDLADRIAPTNITVMLLGESGAGKDMLARYLHQQSPRNAKRLISLNCGALPETLLESELFGHEKGAFTGATATKPGLFEAADGGTLFLDEVGELSPALQVKLLRVLEDRQVLRVGALESRTVDVRFLAATNRDLEQQVAAGKFREDLYYRLNAIALHVPALRERREDIVPLAVRFIDELSESLGKRAPSLTKAAGERLLSYDWPGNVRQLKNVVHRAIVMAVGPDISVDDIELPTRDSRPSAPTSTEPEQLRQLAEEAERKRILEAIEECAGNQTRAAQLLGITRRALIRRLEKFNLPRPRRDSRDKIE